jgi:arylsulfatase A-like enzyme
VTVNKDAPLELYRIADDPKEEHNLAKDYPEMVKEFDAIMHRMHKPSENYPIPEDKKK